MFKLTVTKLTMLVLFFATTMVICFAMGVCIDRNVPRNLRCSVSTPVPRTFRVLIVSRSNGRYQVKGVPYCGLHECTRSMKQWSLLIPIAEEQRLNAYLTHSTEVGQMESPYLHADIVAFRVTQLGKDKQRISLISRDNIVRYCYIASMHAVRPVYFSVYVGRQKGYYALGGLLSVLISCAIWLLAWICLRIVRKRRDQRDVVHH